LKSGMKVSTLILIPESDNMTIHRAAMLTVTILFGLPSQSLISQPAITIWDGVYTQSQAKRGEILYNDACASCHGLSMEGGGMTPAITGGRFFWGYDGLPLEVLYTRIRQTMPPGETELLSRVDTADILAYILRLNDLPSGGREVPYRSVELRLIQWTSIEQI
jgi:cytochrome c5